MSKPQKVYYIAEVGKACNGDLDYCRKLLSECKKAKVNAVRFHHYFVEEIVHSSIIDDTSVAERAWSFELKLPFIDEILFDKMEYKKILNWCRELGIDFIATPWDIKSAELFKNIGIEDYKINSMNAMNYPLAYELLKYGKNVYISTGGLSEKEVENLYYDINSKAREYSKVTFLHAVCAYPAPETILNLKSMRTLLRYTDRTGYSSNDNIEASVLTAVALGAEVIEKHVHLNGYNKELHKASMSIDNFSAVIDQANQVVTAMGIDIKHESRGEMVNQDLFSKSIVLKSDILKGTILNDTNLTLKLPPRGINANQWTNVVGMRAANDLRKGEYLFSSDIVDESIENNIPLKEDSCGYRAHIPGKIGIVARLSDIELMTTNRNIDYVELHFAASDINKVLPCKDYDLDLVIHVPEYADGQLLDLCSYDESFRQFSIDAINDVIQKARDLKPHFKRCIGNLKFIIHPGAMMFSGESDNSRRHYELFADSLLKLKSRGLELLIENMVPFPWYLGKDWSVNQGNTISFMDAEEIYNFCMKYDYAMCLDLCHAKLYTNYAGKDFFEYMKTVQPIVKHLHFSDCLGIDGEGLHIGEGDINWNQVCEVFQNYQYGWTPEIWNGHHNNGVKFFEAHNRLNEEFKKIKA